MEIATIGFTQSSAERFFTRLADAGIKRILDIRLHNVSQLSGFAKGTDLAYFAGEILGAQYQHDVRLAPTDELLTAYRKHEKPWEWYEAAFRQLMRERDIPDALDRSAFAVPTVLVCSEAKPKQCHRRIVAELLAERWGAQIEHL